MRVAWVVAAMALVGCGPSMGTDGGTGGGSGGGGGSSSNLVENSSFENGDLDGWFARDGMMAAVGDAHTGSKAVRLTVPASGPATIAMVREVATNLGNSTYCGTLWARGNCQVRMILRRQTGTSGITDFTFDDLATSTWTRVPPNLKLTAPGELADKLYLLVQTRNANPGDTLDIDDVDVWQSASGRCDER